MSTGCHTFRLGAAMLLFVTALGCARSDAPKSALSDAPEGWAAGPSEVFVGDELFLLINGGAEIYHEYGFESVETLEYTRGEERISTEVYTMRGTAFGVYSWARSASGQPVNIGAGGTLADYYLHFWSGQHLVVVTAQNPGPDPQAAVLDVGRHIGTRYPMEGSTPKLVDLIPADHCPREGVTYFVGPVGFNNVVPRLAPYFSGFDDGVAAECPVPSGETEHIVFLRWSDSSRAAEAVEGAARRIDAAGGARFEAIDNTPPDGERPECIDNESFTVIFDSGVVAAGWRADHIVRVMMADGHRPMFEELPFRIDE